MFLLPVSLEVSVRIRHSVTSASTLVSASSAFSRFVFKNANQSGGLVDLSKPGAYRKEAREGSGLFLLSNCGAGASLPSWGPGGRAPHFIG